jgi:hypothetical protein
MQKENVRIFTLKESLDDPLRDYRWKNRLGYSLIANNDFEVLASEWSIFTENVLLERYFDFLEYVNYLDRRRLFDELHNKFEASTPAIEDIKDHDNKLFSFLRPFPEGLLGEKFSKSVDKQKYWYYFSIPPNVSLDWLNSPSSIIGFYEGGRRQ